MPRYTPEQLEQIFQKLPDELQEAIFSMETANAIYNACLSYGMTDERGNKVAELTGQVLMGLLLPEEFQKSLEKEGGIKKDVSVNIARELTRFVFFPVKESLRQLHVIGPAATAAVKTPAPEPQAPATPRSGSETPQGRTTKGQDTYRESFEEEP